MSLLTACEDKLDGSDKEALNKSVAKMTEKMGAEEKRQFGLDLLAITDAGKAGVNQINNADLNKKFAAQLDGLTLKEVREKAVIARAQEVENRKNAYLAMVEEEKNGYRKKIEADKTKVEQLDKVTVEIANPVVSNAGIVIDPIVTNGSTEEIKSITIRIDYKQASGQATYEQIIQDLVEPLKPGERRKLLKTYSIDSVLASEIRQGAKEFKPFVNNFSTTNNKDFDRTESRIYQGKLDELTKQNPNPN